MKISENKDYFGIFSIGSGRKIHGEIRIDGQKTELYLQDDDFFYIDDRENLSITGQLRDLTKLSLIQCIIRSTAGSSSSRNGSYNFSTIFPHFVISGNSHIDPDEEVIRQIGFNIPDASLIFYDFDAFGNSLNPNKFIDGILSENSNLIERIVTAGSSPIIAYFSGKQVIFEAKTDIGNVSASHNPASSGGGPDGIKIDNTIYVTITPDMPISFYDSIDKANILLGFLDIMAGRPQEFKNFFIKTGADDTRPEYSDVYFSMNKVRNDLGNNSRKIHPVDVPLDPIRRPIEFSSVLTNWISSNNLRREARNRFSDSFEKQNYFDVDRLIAAANMFDILPSSALPPDVSLSEDAKQAKEECRSILKRLPKSQDRDSALGAIGRIGKNNLKTKVRYRAEIILGLIGDDFPELLMVVDEAINCRNYFVHGGERKFDYEKNPAVRSFFIRTLDFVFGASDLIESGWNIVEWSKRGSTMSHPFGLYHRSYRRGLQNLRKLLGE